MLWCDATYDFFVSQLDDEDSVQRGIPRRTLRPPAGRQQAAQAAPAAVAAPAQAPAADQNLETEDDETQTLRRQQNPERRCSAR